MRYMILSEFNVVDIVGSVNKSMADGWKPLGGVIRVREAGTVIYYQTMER